MNEELNKILDQLNIPAKRRDLNDFENVAWLARNLSADNLEKVILVNKAMPMLKDIAKKQLKDMGAY